MLKWKERKGDMLWTEYSEVARRFVLAGGGQYLHTILVGNCTYPENGRTGIADDFPKSCPNVTSLSIGDYPHEWISSFGSQVEKLEIKISSFAVIAETCTSLSELDYYQDCDEADFENLLKTVGNGLECLTLDLEESFEEENDGVCSGIREIKTHCPNLRRITICGAEAMNEGVSKLLASYTDQLEFYFVKGMNESELLM